MQKLSLQMLKEFLWLTLSLALTFLVAVVLFGWAYLKNELGYWLPLMLLFFVVTFIIYCGKGLSTNTERHL
ncbi:MAG: hypothetical protein ABIN94_08660 [Ferruginibacter sp.]